MADPPVRDDKDAAHHSEGRSLTRTLLTLAATYLGTLAVIAYPLGFLTLWIQVWREYTHAATALFAASLIPVAVVVVKAFAALGTALFIIACVSGYVSEAVSNFRFFGYYGEEFREELSGRRFIESFVLGRVWRIFHLLTSCFVGALVPWIFGLVSIDSGLDTFYYACSVLIAGGGAAFGTFRLFENLDKEHNLRATFAKALLPMISSVVVAVFLLIPLQPPKFPVVRFSEGPVREAALISHSEGYWYVVEEGETDVRALPDDAVGEASVSEAPNR